MQKFLLQVNPIIAQSELLSWEEKLVIMVIMQNNEYFGSKEGFKPSLKWFAEKFSLSQAKVKFTLLKLIKVGILELTGIPYEEQGNTYRVNEKTLEAVLEEKIVLFPQERE